VAAVGSSCAATVGGVLQRGKQTNTHLGKNRRPVNQEVEPSKTVRFNFQKEDAIAELAKILELEPRDYEHWYSRQNTFKVQSLHDLATSLNDLGLPMITYAHIFQSIYEIENLNYLDLALDNKKKNTVIDTFFSA
jgi:hypothetical protein